MNISSVIDHENTPPVVFTIVGFMFVCSCVVWFRFKIRELNGGYS